VAYVWPILLLVASNVFMTLAWYGHLKFTSSPLWIVTLASWGIAFFEYVLQVPANRMGDKVYSVTQSNFMQEEITLTVFIGFAWMYFNTVPNWRTGLAISLVTAAVVIVSRKAPDADPPAAPTNGESTPSEPPP